MPKKRNYHTNKSSDSGNRIRVRGKRLDQVDESKLSLAFWLLARRLTEDKTDGRMLTEDEVRKVAGRLNQPDPAAKPSEHDEPESTS